MRIAISTGGGDAPGLNAVIRAAVLSAIDRGWDVLGIKRGYAGLLGDDDVIPLNRESVSGIGHLGGTILRTTNRGNPFHFPERQPDGSIIEIDRSDELIERANELGIDAILTIGGDGSLSIAQKLFEKGVKIVAVPKTIDNDVSMTITSFGFDTAVSTAIEAIDKLHTTAESHDRVITLEVMGRDAGFIALYSGARDPNAHRKGVSISGARPPAARRHAHGLRPVARDAVRRRGGASHRGGAMGRDGGAAVAAHRLRADLGSVESLEARRARS